MPDVHAPGGVNPLGHISHRFFLKVAIFNHHLVLTKREWTAVINALDFLDQEMHGDKPVQDFVREDLERLFPHGFLCELSEKIATSK